jgi:flagellar FliL protein
MKKKLPIILVVVLIVAAAGYKFTRPKPVVKMKINGTVYVMPKDFLLNLSDGRYAKVTVGLLLAPGQSDGVTAANASSTPSDGIGTLPEEAVVRDIITNIITNKTADDLIESKGRLEIKSEILAQIKKETDVKVTQVLFPDIAVQ